MLSAPQEIMSVTGSMCHSVFREVNLLRCTLAFTGMYFNCAMCIAVTQVKYHQLNQDQYHPHLYCQQDILWAWNFKHFFLHQSSELMINVTCSALAPGTCGMQGQVLLLFWQIDQITRKFKCVVTLNWSHQANLSSVAGRIWNGKQEPDQEDCE